MTKSIHLQSTIDNIITDILNGRALVIIAASDFDARGLKIVDLADATADTDALNRQSADGRYIQGMPVVLIAETSSQIPLTVRGASGQTANLIEITDAALSKHLWVEGDGDIWTGTGDIYLGNSGGGSGVSRIYATAGGFNVYKGTTTTTPLFTVNRLGGQALLYASELFFTSGDAAITTLFNRNISLKTTSNGVIIFKTNSTERARIKSTGELQTSGGRIVAITRTASFSYSIIATDHQVFANTDSNAVTVELPAGADGRYLRIINTGTVGNAVTIQPNGSEDLLGTNSNFSLKDGESLIITYDPTDGWY